MKGLKTIYLEGHAAGFIDGTRTNCPYHWWSLRGQAWNSGWYKGITEKLKPLARGKK